MHWQYRVCGMPPELQLRVSSAEGFTHSPGPATRGGMIRLAGHPFNHCRVYRIVGTEDDCHELGTRVSS
jgi:hypothetical protein